MVSVVIGNVLKVIEMGWGWICGMGAALGQQLLLTQLPGQEFPHPPCWIGGKLPGHPPVAEKLRLLC